MKRKQRILSLLISIMLILVMSCSELTVQKVNAEDSTINGTKWINDEETYKIKCKQPGGIYKLEVKAESSTGESLKYQWAMWNDETDEYDNIIDGATTPIYNVTKGSGDEWFGCIVRTESGTVEKTFSFVLYADSLSAKAKVNGVQGATYKCLKGESVTLSIEATSSYDQNGIKYRWYKCENDEDVDSEIELGTNSELTIIKSSDEEEVIHCSITDGFETIDGSFYIELSTISIKKVTMNGIETFNFKCKNGDKVTMSVEAESDNQLTYQWWVTGSEDVAPDDIEGATGNTLTVVRGEGRDENGKEYYLCEISDGNHSRDVRFCLEEETCNHTFVNDITAATSSKDGKIINCCSKCGYVQSVTTISRPSKVILSKTSYTYNGKVQTPGVTVIGANGQKISSSNYNIAYSLGRKNVGQYTVKISFKGNYSGTLLKSFVINPKGSSLSKVTSGKKNMTVKWKKQSKQVKGYQIQYSTDKTFKKSVKSMTVTNYKITSKVIKKLISKKTYYIRIRTYQNANGKNYYSSWSGVKKVKIK